MTSVEMDGRGDELTPLDRSRGPASTLLPGDRAHARPTSDSTPAVGFDRQPDVAPTVLRFFDVAIPSDMDGNAIHSHAPGACTRNR